MAGSKKQSYRPIKNVPMSELQAEMKIRQRMVDRLSARREKLSKKIQEIDSELDHLGALGSINQVRRRPKNEMNLVDSIAKLIKNKTMSVTDIADEVRRRGYKTTSTNFRTIVNQALIRETKIFKKVSRGQYTAR